MYYRQMPELLQAPNGFELSCPAEAGIHSHTLRQAGGQFKKVSKHGPPGQL
jgi:hypothetical protein